MSDLDHWDGRYRDDQIPWNTDQPSRELVRLVESGQVPVGSALEFGCGYGSDALYLAAQGFAVTAVDLSPLAVSEARERAAKAGASVEFQEADLTAGPDLGGPYDFLFDRGVYHIVRRSGLEAFLALLERVSRPGTRYLSLTGNTHETGEGGPPRVSEEEIQAELGTLFEIVDLREFRWEESVQMKTQPLGWSVLLERR